MMIECHIQIQAAEINDYTRDLLVDYTEKLFSCPHSLLNSTSIIFSCMSEFFCLYPKRLTKNLITLFVFLPKNLTTCAPPPLLSWKKMFDPALTNNDNNNIRFGILTIQSVFLSKRFFDTISQKAK